MKVHFIVLCVGLTTFSWAGNAQMGFGSAGPKISYEAVLEQTAAHPGASVRGALRVSLSEGWHVNSHKPLEEYLIPTVLRFDQHPILTVRGIVYPEHKMFTFDFSPDPLAVYEETFVLGFVVEVDSTATPGDYTLNGTLRYQACSKKMCAPPRDLSIALSVPIVAADSPVERVTNEWIHSVKWETIITLEDSDKKADESVYVEPESPQPGTGRPDDSITMPGVGLETTDSSKDWRNLVSRFEISGTLPGYTQKEGFLAFVESVERGESPFHETQNKRWWWLLPIVLGGGVLLNLTPCVLPLIPINVAILGAGARAGSRKRGFALGAAYGLGIAVVYGALGLVVVLGLSAAFGSINSTPWFNGAIAILFIILGLAMFDLVVIDFSKYQARLKIPGGGHFLAALGMGAVSALLAGACVAPVVIYTILHAQDLYSQGYVVALALPFGLGVGMALPWPFLGAGLSFLPKPGKWMDRVKQAFGVFILTFSAYYGYMAYTLYTPQVKQVASDGNWVHSLEEGLSLALEEQKPVIIDFWATWCKNCLVMDRTVLRDSEVLDKLRNHVKIKYQAEILTESPVKEVVDYFGVMGLPTFVVLKPKG